MKKKIYHNKKKILKFLKEYISVIAFLTSGIGLILNIGIWYYQQCKGTDFIINYYIQKISQTKKESTNSEIEKHMSYETVNNDLNQIIRKYKEELKEYHVTYLILEEYDEIPAQSLKLILKKTKKEIPEALSDLNIKIEDGIQEFNIKYTIPQNSGIKVPISICKYEEQTMKKLDCIIEEYEPLSINYKNKYLLSRQRKEVREITEDLVVFENEVINGKGDIYIEKPSKKWFQK